MANDEADFEDNRVVDDEAESVIENESAAPDMLELERDDESPDDFNIDEEPAVAYHESQYAAPEVEHLTSDESSAHTESSPSAPPTFFEWIKALFTNRRRNNMAELEHRLQTYHYAIERHPEAATNHVLRGELYLELGEYELAHEDLSRGLELAADQFKQDNWGIVSQTMRDRAEVGLRRTIKHLKRIRMSVDSDE